MSKRRDQQRANRLVENLNRITLAPAHEDEDTEGLLTLLNRPIAAHPDTRKSLRMKKFRFQLLHEWLVGTFAACRAADIGGGKGLLGYLLAQSGWEVTVIDPYRQALPDKYKDIRSEARVKIPATAQVAYLAQYFESQHAQGFDLLLGMHAHGCNVKIIDAAAEYGCGFAIFPCCVIDEPFYPPIGVHWLESLADYAVQRGLAVRTIRLNFKGQNIGLYTQGKCRMV